MFRVPSGRGPGLVLRAGERAYDLGARLAADGIGIERAADTLALWEAGILAGAGLDALLARGPWREVPAPGEVLLPLPRERVGKILALGKNFRDHAAEFGEEPPAEPMFFAKLPETMVPHGATVCVPDWVPGRVDHEAELALVIGRAGRDLAPADAWDHVAGYTVANDLTARTLQGRDRELRHPWLRAKNLDGFCPLGPCFVPRDALDVSDLRVRAEVRGELRQDASTRDWIVGVPRALAWLSRHLTLRPGDVVLMGTPAGVGPLEDGDTVTCSVEGIGELTVTIARPVRPGA